MWSDPTAQTGQRRWNTSVRDVELEEANAEIDRLSEAVKELAVKLMLLEKKGGSE